MPRPLSALRRAVVETIRDREAGVSESRLEFVLIELPCAGGRTGLFLRALMRVLHHLARTVVETCDQGGSIRSRVRGSRNARLVDGIHGADVEAEIIDRELRGLIAARALAHRRLELCTDRRIITRR